MATKQTESLEDYLEATLLVKEKEGIARISTISEFLGLTKPSVSYAIKRLVEQGLVVHEDYGCVDLTPEGQFLAEKIAGKHELLTTFIAGILGVNRKKAEHEACSMEHYLSDETRDKLEGLVEFILSGPKTDEWLENLRYYQKNRTRSQDCLKKCRGLEQG